MGRTQIHHFDVRHMGFSQHSELRMERRSLQRLAISVGVTIPILGHIPVSAGLITATIPIGVSLLGRLLSLLGYYPGWGGGHHHHPYPPHHRPNVVHRSTYRYGSGAGSNIGSTSFGGRGQGGMTNGYRNGTTIGSGSFRGGSTSNSSSSFRGGSSSVNRGSSTYRNPSFGGNSSSYRGSSSTPNRGTYTPAPSQPNRGSSGSFVGGGGGVRGGNSSGRNSYGR